MRIPPRQFLHTNCNQACRGIGIPCSKESYKRELKQLMAGEEQEGKRKKPPLFSQDLPWQKT
jgi:hypothetical protein